MVGKRVLIVRTRDMQKIHMIPEDKTGVFSREIVLTAKDQNKAKMQNETKGLFTGPYCRKEKKYTFFRPKMPIMLTQEMPKNRKRSAP